MDAHLFRMLGPFLETALAGSRIEKIQEPAAGHLAITFYDGSQKRTLCLRFGRNNPFCFFLSSRPVALPKPSMQVMRLRKYFGGRRVASVVFQPWSRKIWLMAAGGPRDGSAKSVWMCLDLALGPCLRFLGEDELPAAETVEWPEPDELPDALENWRDWPCLTPALRRTLAVLDKYEAAALLADLRDGGGDVFLYANPGGKIEKASAWPLPAAQRGELAESPCQDVLKALEKAGQDIVLASIHSARERQEELGESRRQKKLRKILSRLEDDRKRLEAMRSQEDGARIIAENLWRLPKEAKERELLAASADGGQMRVVLDERYTIYENMERMFNAAKRGKRGLAMLEQRRADLLSGLGLPVAREKQDGREKTPPEPRLASKTRHVQSFMSSDGYRMLRGRDAKGNQNVRRMAAGHDLWAHVAEGPGAHVIIRRAHAGDEPPLRTLLEAGALAANKSWLHEAGSADVMYAEARHVKTDRNGPPGKVTIDKVRQTLTVAVDMGLEERLQASPRPAEG